MSASPINSSILVVLLDIEGTTTPIDFVYKTLFPYARLRVAEFLSMHHADLGEEIEGLLSENAEDIARDANAPEIESAKAEQLAAYVHWLMDQDRKTTALKSLQGKIWEAGYRACELHSQVFADVPPALKRWRGQGKDVCIYSSGSVLAQKLLFANTEAGDLTPLISGYFDTNVGAKAEAASYRRIADAVKARPSAIVFVSDVTSELQAAASAGLETLLCVRPGNHPQTGASKYTAITSFDEVFK